jgi:phosphate-selective porin OprO and OprP
MGLGQTPDSTEQTQADRVRALEQKVEQLEKQTAQQAKSATVSADSSGFGIRSSNGDFLLKIGGDLQVDNRSYLGTATTILPDTILLRRLRPTVSGTVYRFVDFYIRPDFGQGNVVVADAYFQLNYVPRAALRIGKFKPPVGLERLQGADDTNFVERSFPTLLVPSRDIGFQLAGDVVKQRVAYAIGGFNGVPDNSLADVAVNDHRDFAARLFLTPFLPAKKNLLRGLGVGVGGSSGSVNNLALPSYKSFGQNSFVSFASGVTSAGHRNRLAPQAYYYAGPFGLLAEYGLTEEGFQKGTVRRDIAFRAWQVAASYILTGENKGFTYPTPRRHFDPRERSWGAFEVAARIGDFNAEQGLYNYGFAAPTNSARRAHEWVAGVNWYLDPVLRISLDYGRTNFLGGSATGNRPSEKALLARFLITLR